MNRPLAWLAGAIVAASWLALFVPLAAHAQTVADCRACLPDAVRFCGVKAERAARCTDPIKASIGEMLVCGARLLLHRAELSPACRAVFAAHGR
jgi:hypothetical protein